MGIERLDSVASNPQQKTENTLLYDTKAKRKAAVNQAISDYMKYGTADGKQLTEKEAKKAAKYHVENQRYKEEYETFNNETTVYADKKAYKAAKKAQEKAEKEFVKNRAKGVSKKEARKQFEAQNKEIELASRSARKGFAKLGLVEANGTVGDKAKNFMLEQAQKGNQGETQNYYYQLKERRATKADLKAQGTKISVNALGKMADATGIHREKNRTWLIRGAAAAAIVGAGVATGGLTATSASAADAASTAAAGNAATGAAAEAAATGFGAATAHIGGGLIGAALAPLALLTRDPGRKVHHVAEPGKPQPPKPQPQPQPQPEPVVEPQPQPQPCPEENWESEYCDHKVKYGDTWSNVAQGKVRINGKKIDGKLLRAYVHAEKLQHGVTDFTKNTFMNKGDNYRLYTDFSHLLENEEIIKKHPELLLLKDAKIEIDCDGDYTPQKSTSKTFRTHHGNPFETNKYKQACDDLVPVRVNN